MSKSLIGGITNRVLMLVAAALLVLSCVSAFANPARTWYLMLPGLFFFPLALLNLFLLLWAILRRSKAFVIPLIALLPTLFFAGRYFHPGDGTKQMSGEENSMAIRIVSYNVGRFANLRDKDGKILRRQCEDSVYAFLRQTEADIICLQEYYSENTDALRATLEAGFGGHDYDFYVFQGKYGCFGNVILSRFPILDQGVIKFEHSANLAIFTDIKAHGQQFRLYNCHFESYNISFPGLVKGLADRKDSIWKETEKKMRRSLSLRPEQVDKVIRHIADCPSETILCGDFNDSPMSYTYQKLIRGHIDTFREAGHGFGATYSILWPALRIDYMFLPETYEALSHSSPHMKFSDHYPVIAEFIIPDAGNTADTSRKSH